ncbi:MAG: glycoside hydrolase family 1 protein, partial [Crenarchaeota archaeon]|nr:glycoside hydrolase family 1 protein [Thermoproteota archaeon]
VEFAKFAAYIAWKFGDLVDMWSTFNEPLVMVELGYLFPEAGFPPGVRSVEAARDALVNVIVAHARAYDAIKRWDRRRVKGAPEEVVKVGIIHNIIPVHPASPSDEEAAAKLDYLHNRLILDAVTKGGAPLSMKRGELLSVSHLSGKLDWIGVNYYTRAVARASESAPSPFENLGVYLAPGYGSLCSPNSESRDGYPCSDFGWEIYPRGIAEALDIASSYGLPTMITENGVADSRDVYRPMFVVRHLATLESYLESGGRAMGYLHWALTDNYEWAKGFRMRFGLVEVDLASKERRPRPSAFIYAKIASENTVPRSLREQYGALDA